MSEIGYGYNSRITGTLNKPINNTIPNTFNYKKYLESKGIYYTLNIEKLEIKSTNTPFIYKIKNLITKRLDNYDKKGYLKAFILGDKNNIDNEVYTSYQKIGITHLFALSGMHVGLLSSIIIKLLKRRSDCTKYLFVNTFLIIYGFLVSFPSSIKRCILFFILNSINKLLKTNLSSIKIIILTICILILFDYKIIYDVGFKYSVCTVLGIILSNNFIKSESKIASSFKLSLVAFLFSLPINLTNFYEVNFLSVLYNIIFVPFISIIVYPLSLITFIFPFLYSIFDIIIFILESTALFLSKITNLNIYLNFSLLEVIAFYIVLYFSFCKERKIFFLGILLIIILDIVIPYFDSNAYLYFFDIGQGDSSLLIGPKKKDIILIDTGGIVNFNSDNEYLVSDNVITFLKSKGIKKIDLLVLSHGDADHAKEVENIYKEIKINSLKINPGEVGYYEKIALDLIKKQNYQPKSIEVKYLNYKDYQDENANSLLTWIKIYNTEVISFGDATKEAEEDIIKKYNLKDIDIAKISHHGSKTSSSKKYLSVINPNIAIISSGRNNRFKHPNQETIDSLNQLNIKYLNTQESGTIEFIISQNNVTYQEYKP